MAWKNWPKGRVLPGLRTAGALPALLGGRRFGGFAVRRTVEQFDVGHRRIVADAEAHLEDAQVTAIAVSVAGAEHVEDLAHDFAVTQTGEREATVRQVRRLAEVDQRLDDAP